MKSELCLKCNVELDVSDDVVECSNCNSVMRVTSWDPLKLQLTEESQTEEARVDYDREAVRVQGLVNEPKPTTRAWNPKVFWPITIFFSFLPAGIMYALNFERLGQPEKKQTHLLFVILGYTFYLGIAFGIPQLPKGLFYLVNGLIAWGFYKGQKQLYERHIERGGEKAPIGLPLALSLLWLVILLGGVFGWAYLSTRH